MGIDKLERYASELGADFSTYGNVLYCIMCEFITI